MTHSKIRRKDIVFVQKRRYGCLHVFQSDFRWHQIPPSWKEQKKPKGKVKCGLAGKRSWSSTCAYLPGSQQPTRQSQHGTASRAAGMWPSPCPCPEPVAHAPSLCPMALGCVNCHLPDHFPLTLCPPPPAIHPDSLHIQSMNILFDVG